MRRVVLDTETTGLSYKDGDRIIEIGCVEVDDRSITGRNYHQYINPEREVPVEAFEIHGISNEFLADKPLISDVITEFLDFIYGSELIIHNATFDVGFLNNELAILGVDKRIEDICTVLDTVALARKKFPGSRVTLDNLSKRFGINIERDLHGALLDAEILAHVYLAMTGGQSGLHFSSKTKVVEVNEVQEKTDVVGFNIQAIEVSKEEVLAHNNYFKE